MRIANTKNLDRFTAYSINNNDANKKDSKIPVNGKKNMEPLL
jgi:hypothetical protein